MNLNKECRPLAAKQKLLEVTNFHRRQVDVTLTQRLGFIKNGTFEFKKDFKALTFQQ